MTLVYANLAVLAAALTLVRARGIGWRWGVVTAVGWAVAACCSVGAAAAGWGTPAGRVCAALSGVYVIGVIALAFGRERLFRWIVGCFGLPATVFILGGPG